MAAGRPPHLLVAGAGIGGLAAALALARIGARITLLERAEALSEIGAGLQVSPNAARILARLGVLDAVATRATRPAGIRVRGARSGRTLALMPLDDAARRWGAPYLVCRRADLQRALAAAAAADPAITLHLGTALAGFGAAQGGVRVAARQGRVTRTFEADALVGADGVRSTVREKLIDGTDDAPRETGRTAWRALVDAEAAPSLLRDAETGLWLGRDAHLVHYPLDNGRRINVVAISRDAVPAAADEIWARPGDPALVQARFARWHPAVRGLIAAAEGWTTWPLFDRAPLATWAAGPVALLGDAAHPILPFLAQGAAQAIEDADALAAAVAGTRSLPDALAAYSRARLVRATRVQQASRDLGRIYHLAGPAALARNAGMRALGPRRLLARYDWLYGAGAP